MKIGLISPKVGFTTEIEELRDFWYQSTDVKAYREYWSGLGCALLILAALTPSSHKVVLIDENIEDIDFAEHFDVVGITAITQQAVRAYEIADTYRRNDKEKPYFIRSIEENYP